MSVITSKNNCFGIGADFVDAAKALNTFNGLKYQGTIKATKDKGISFVCRQWFSRLDAQTTENIIRLACKDEGYAVIEYTWQSV